MRYQDEMMKELEETLNFFVNSGYYSEQEIFEYSLEIVPEIISEYRKSDPTSQEISNIIQSLKQAVPKTDNFKRLRQVFDQLNSEFIIAIDYAGFDTSEGHEDVGSVFNVMKEYDIPRKGYCFFHQQDIERCLGKPGTLYLAFHSMTGDEEIAMEVGQRIVELLRANHFDVHWEETLDRKIGIKNFHWDKQYDEQLSSVARSLSVITKSHK